MSLKPSPVEIQAPALSGWHATSAADKAVLLALGSSFLLYFMVRGWLNAAPVVLFLFAVGQFALGHAPASRRVLADTRVRWLVAALAAPLVAVAAVQLLRHEFVPRYFDAPLRLFMAGVILVYLLARRIDFLRLAGIVFPLGVLLSAAYLFGYPGAAKYFWTYNRMATYFMDPLTLAAHITIAGFVSLFLVDAGGTDPVWLRVLKYCALGAALAVSIATGSRSGWVMVPLLVSLWLIGHHRVRHPMQVLFSVFAISVACFALYWGSDVVHARVAKGIEDVVGYFDGGSKDTSLGVRLSLVRANWILFLQNPLYGWGFQSLPVLSSIPQMAGFYTPALEGYFVRSGGHNELLQNMMRMGVLGLVSRLMLFLVPAVLFARAARSALPRRRCAGYVGLVAVIGYFTASFSMEVFNLLYASSFYGLLIASFAAVALQETPP